VQAISDSGTVISDFDRARIAVLAESWGCWVSLGDALAECPRDAHAPQALAIIEGTPRGAAADERIASQLASENSWPGCTAVGWIACQRCEEVLARVHETVPWKYPSFLTSVYVIFPSGVAFSTGAAALGALADVHQRP
jgi:hypothetical protein